MIKNLLFCLVVFISTSFFAQVFSPSNYSNLSLWLKADAGVTLTSGAVSQWTDQSGNGYNATQSTVNLRPTQVTNPFLNSKPVIRFDGTDDVLGGVTIPNINSDNMTLFVISSGGSQSANMSGFFTIGTLATGLYVTRSISATQAFRIWTNSNAGLTSSANSVPTGGYNGKLLSFVRELGVQGKLAVNGTQQANTTNATFLGTFTNAAYQIGKAPSYSTLNGDIAEIIVYNRILTSAEQTQVEKYLMDKYAPPVSLGADINDTYGFEDITLSSPGYYTNYSWSTGATSSTININLPGTYWVQTTDVFGRVSRDTVAVTRPDYASVQLANQLLCYNGNITVTANLPVGDYQFVQWSDGIASQSRTISQTSTLSYTVKDNLNNSRSSNSATFTLDNSLQNVRLGNDTTLCQGNSIQLVQSSPVISGYLWNTGQTTSSLSINSTGQYVLRVTNGNGCIKSDSILVTIQGQSPTIVYSVPSQFCQNEGALFSESSYVPNGDLIGSRVWNFGNSTSSLLSSGLLSNNVTGTYNGTLTVTSAAGCQSIQSFSYVVRPKPLSSYTSPLLCDNVSAQFTNTSTAPSSTLSGSEWFVDDVLTGSSLNLTYTYPIIGSYALKLVVTNGFGCSDTSVQTQNVINTYPLPNSPNLSDPFNGKTVLSTDQIPFSWSTVSDNYFYELQFSTSSSFGTLLSTQTTTQPSQTIPLNASGTVYWRVKANNPCLLGGTSSVFTLNSIQVSDSLKLWLKADAGVNLSSGGVSQWTDQSGWGNHATQTTATLRPTVFTSPTLNNASVIRFDGTDDVLAGTTISNLQSDNMTMFVLNSGNSQSGSMAGLFSIGTLTNGLALTRSISTTQAFRVWTNNSAQLTSLANSAPTSGYLPKIVTMSREVGVQGKLSVNGSQQATTTNAPFLAPFTNAAYQIGKAPSYSTLNGEIAEVIVYNRILTATEQTQLEKYLMDKYAKPVNLGPDITSLYGFCDIALTSNAYFQSYVWSTGATSSTININEPGSYWVQATDVFGRITTDTIVVTRPHYASIALQNQTICYNNPQTITATIPVGDYQFVQWNDGLTTPSRFQTQGQSLNYTLKDNLNCTKTSNTALITLDNTLQSVRLGNDTSLCVGNTIELAVTSPVITSYLWNTNANTPSIVLDTTGEYILEVSNSNACIKRDTIQVTIIGQSPTIVYSVPSQFCQNEGALFSESSYVPNGDLIGSRVWNFGNSTSSLLSSGLLSNNVTGTYNGTLTVTSAAGCQSVQSFSYVVRPKPLSSYTSPLLCDNVSAQFTNISTAPFSTLSGSEWFVDDVLTGGSLNLTYTHPIIGSYALKLVVTNGFGCKDTSVQTQNVINTYPVPNAPNLSDPFNGKTVLSTEQIPFSWSSVSDNYFYELQFSTSSSFGTLLSTQTTTQPSQAIPLNASGTVYWRVKANNPCLLGGTSSVFTLNSIHVSDSLKLWLKADAGVNLSSGGVSQWTDQSGRGNHATQTTATLRPTVFTSPTLNNASVIRFDGTDDVLAGTTISNLQNDNMTLFVLNSGNSQSGNMAGLFSIGTLTNGLSLTRSISTTQAFRVWTNNSAQLTSLANSAPTSGYLPKIVTMSREVGVEGKLSVNGSQQATTSNAPFLSPFTNAAYQIGRAPSYSTLNGDIAEVIVYNRILTATEQTQVEKYLMDKYAPPISFGSDITSNYGFCDTLLTPKGYFTNYLWSNGATTSTLSVNQPGTYWVRATDIFGRISSDTIQVIRPVYDSISLENRIVCYNALIEETAFVPSGYTFVNWNDGNLNSTRLLNQNENLSYTVADNRNCQLTSNLISVSIDSSLYAISLGLDTNLCVGNLIELQQTSSSITNYLWNTGNTTPSQTLDTAGVFILEVQNQNNCFNRDSIEITIDGFSPEIVFNFPFENCQFSDVLFSESSTVQGSTIASTSWTIDNQTPILNSSGQITFNQPGIVSVSLEVVSAQNCRSIDTFSITVHPKPIVNFTTVNYCPYQNIEFNPINLASSQLTSYDWNFGQVSSSSNTSQQTNPSHFYGLEGTYSVNLKVVNEYGCKDTLIQDVLIQPAPISSFSVQNTCENTFVEFTNTSSIPSGYSIASNIWSYGDNTNAINPTVGKGYENYGDYLIELIVVGNNGCSDTSSNSITIYPNPILNWSLTPSCKNTLTVFEDLSTIPEGTLVSTDWLVNLQYPFTTPVASYRFATLGVQYLNLTSTSDKNCTSDTLILVNVNPELNANFNYTPINIVAGVPVTFTDLSIGSTTATWDLGIGEELIIYTPPLNQFAKTYPLEWVDSLINVTLFVENQIGCKDTLTKSFGVQSPAFDLEVKSIFIQEINGFNTIGVEFENKGTIAITSIDFQLTSLNSIPIQETWSGNLLSNQDLIYMFNAKLSAYNSTQDDLTDFVCVEGFASDNLGNVDLVLGNNKVCQNVENESIALISVAPNPTEALTNVSLLIPATSEPAKLKVSLYNMSGEIVQYVIDNQVVEQGIFYFNVDFSNLSRGIYLLKIEDGTSSKVIRLSKI